MIGPVKLVSVSDAAKEKGISREAVYQAIQQGRLKVKRVLGKIGIIRSSLDAYQPNATKIRAGQLRAQRTSIRSLNEGATHPAPETSTEERRHAAAGERQFS